MKTLLRVRPIGTILAISSLILLVAGTVWAQEYSHARVVRLSFVEGKVTLARPDTNEGMTASVNMPIQEGFKLGTAANSFAEVEFENTSTARVGELSELDFDQLGLDSNGAKLNRMVLRQGYATFHVFPEDGDVYDVKVGEATVTPNTDKPILYRVDLDGDNVRVEVFKGDVEVSSLFGAERVGKNDVYEMRPGTDQAVTITHGITKDNWDAWVNERDKEAQVADRKNPPGAYTNDSTALLYGWNDLYYYGNWSTIPGYGYGWIPAAGIGWSPYSDGQWMWYPGYGFTWISYEPWGWLPFHYGGWIYDPYFGWAWIPGGFNTWSPSLVNWYQGQGWVGWTPRPPHPRPGGRPMPAGPVCSAGVACATVVSTDSFRAGMPVRGHIISGVIVTSGSAVAQPTAKPEIAGGANSSGMILVRSHQSPAYTGPAERMPANGPPAAGAGHPAASLAGARAPSHGLQSAGFRSGVGAQGGVVYDPSEGRYVNGPSTPAQPLQGATSKGASGGTSAPPAPLETPRVAPAASRPEPMAPRKSVNSRPAFSDEHHASPRTGVESKRATGTFEKTVESWGGASNRQSAPSRSGGWSAPASRNSGSWGGARSGGSWGGSPRMGGGGGGGGAHSAPASHGGAPHR